MELQHRLIRQSINIAISKAIDDMQNNTRRSIRNLLDLGLLFASDEDQKRFFSTAKKAVSNPHNPYNAFVARVIANVNIDTIKTFSINLGYSSLTYGANLLRKLQAKLGCSMPWILVFDLEHQNDCFFDHLSKYICDARDMGIYSFLFRINAETDIAGIIALAEKFGECAFILETPSVLLTDKALADISRIHNLAVLVRTENSMENVSSCDTVFQKLHSYRCLYGFHTGYNKDSLGSVANIEYIDKMVSQSCLFGAYVADGEMAAPHRDGLFSNANPLKDTTGLPLVTIDLFSDIRSISEKIAAKGQYIVINSVGEAYSAYKKIESVFNLALIDIIHEVMPQI